MSFNRDQDNMIKISKMKHVDVINEQIKMSKKARESQEREDWKNDKLVFFPFTHGDQID
jgi:hypothetical protein